MHIKLLITLFLLGCGSISLDPGAEKVVLSKYQPEGCTHLGSITGRKCIGICGSDENANNDLRNKALKLGGNVVEVVTNSFYEISGTAYKCPDRVVNSLNSSNQ